MSLSSDLISQFVKATKDDTRNVTKETTVYGTTIEYEGRTYVKLDGSDLLTPIKTTAEVLPNERVTVMIKDHTATITGNLSSPSARTDTVSGLGAEISEFGSIISHKVTTNQLEAINATIESLKAKVAVFDNMEAISAEIYKLEAKYANVETLSALDMEVINGYIQNLEVMFGEFTDLTAGDLEAITADIDQLKAYNAEFTYVSAEVLDAVKASIRQLEADFANIDAANIDEATIGKLFTTYGVIKELTMSDGTVTRELVGVTIKGDLIEGNTIVADKLVVKGEDGLYYRLNTDGMNVEAEQTDENSLNGSVIQAQSITATKIKVDDLFAFDATLGGFVIDEHALRTLLKTDVDSAAAGVYMNDEGEFAVGDTTNFLKFYKDENGNFKLDLSAAVITMGGSSKTIREEISDAQTAADTAQTTASSAESRLVTAQSVIDSIVGQLATLVTDGTGASLMTQTEQGWTFKTTGIQNSVDSVRAGLESLTTSYGNTNQVVNTLNSAVADLQKTTEYVRIVTYEDEPCIELGESDSNFRLLITNTRIMFFDGAGAIPTYIDRNGIVTDNIDVKNTIKQGNFSWILRPNGHLSLLWSETPPITYSVNTNLGNVSLDNELLIAEYGKVYSTVIVPNVGYEISQVMVTMNGIDITLSAYDSTTKIVTVSNVSGNISIQAIATVINWTIENSLSNVATNNIATSIQYGSPYTTTLTPTDGYFISHVAVIMGDTNITSSVYDDGVINIPSVTGNLMISASGLLIGSTLSVANNLTNVSSSNTTTAVEAGGPYTATLMALTNYTMQLVVVTMGGIDITSEVYDPDTLVISIPNVTGDIEITASALMITYTIWYQLTNSNATNVISSLIHGSSYSTTLTPSTNYRISSVVVTMGGVDVTNSVYNASTGVVTISSVTGEVVISCTSVLITYSITSNLSNCTLSNNSITANHGSSYNATLTANAGYALEEVVVMMGGTIIDEDGWVTSVVTSRDISIGAVNGDIVISAVALKAYDVTINVPTSNTGVAWVDFTNKATSVVEGRMYNNTFISTRTNYYISRIDVTMGGVDISDSAYDYATKSVTIQNITGDVEIDFLLLPGGGSAG